MSDIENVKGKKRSNLRRNKKISIRVFDHEKLDLLDRCTGSELAVWMRETCLAQKPKRPPKYPTIDPQLLRQLSGIGNNLNQVARHLNSKHFNPVDTVKVISTLQSMAENIAILTEQNRVDHDR